MHLASRFKYHTAIGFKYRTAIGFKYRTAIRTERHVYYNEMERAKKNAIATKHLCRKNSAANKQPPIKQSKMEF